MRNCTRAIVMVMTVVALSAAAFAANTSIPAGSGPNPWTNVNFVNKSEDFQFAIVSDRTGGMRPGIFEKAVGKLNLLQPEFVMCVGDLVEGNAKDEAEYIAQRDEFDAILKPLQAPFFYVPGNHDVTNTPFGAEIWKKRYGKLYYHFVYQDVLFLCLNSDDGGTERISDEQFEYIKKALDEAPKARWTFVFMHKPLWAMPKAQGWDRVEKLLTGRPHTVFTGHRHEYMKYDRNGTDYFVLGTTGAGMAHQGPLAGEFDEIVWVTLAKDGPRFANLMLDGILDKNVRTEASAKLTGPLLKSKPVTAAPIVAPSAEFKGCKAELRIVNPADIPLRAAASFDPSDQITPHFNAVNLVIPPHGEQRVTGELSPALPIDAQKLQPLVSRWTLTYETPEYGKLEVPVTERIVIDTPRVCSKVTHPVTSDGAAPEWDKLSLACIEPGQLAPSSREWSGPGDGSFRFCVTHDGTNLNVIVQVTDDQIENSAKGKSKKRDLVTLLVDARPENARTVPANAKEKPGYLTLAVGPGANGGKPVTFDADTLPEGVRMDARADAAAPGYTATFAVPESFLNTTQGKPWESLRVNIGVADFDSPSDTGTTLWWRPVWSADDGGKTGTFTRGE